MKHIETLIVALIITLTAASCGGKHENDAQTDITVTILPLKYIVENITGDDFKVDVLVPSGASPETFEPTPKQYIALNEAQMIFTTGLIDFENALLSRLENREKLVKLSRGIDLMEGSCSHDHSHEAEAEGSEHAEKGHRHGIDPHIWTSPRELKIMARNAFEAIARQYPDSAKYRAAYDTLAERLDCLDRECKRMCDASESRAFVIYHPALTYFARAYGMEQITVESDGKEPSAKHIARIIDEAREDGVTCLLYQSQYPRSTVEIIARDMGVECREIDPLAEDVANNIIGITRLITGN